MVKLKFFEQIIVLPRRKKNAAWLNPQPQAWQTRPKFHHAKWFPWMLVRPVQRKRRVADWLNPQPQVWQQRPVKKKHLPTLVVHPKKHTKVAATLPFVAITTWTPRPKFRYARWMPLIRQWHKTRKVAAWLNPQPFIWQQRPIKHKHLPILTRPKKHAKVAGILAVPPAVPVFVPFKRKHVHRAALYRRPTKRGRNTAIIGGRNFLLPPSQAWNWQGTAPNLGFTFLAVSKAWHWSANAANLNFTLPAPAVAAWNWATQNPAFTFTMITVRQTWNWVARAAVITGGNITPVLHKGYDIMQGVMRSIMRGITRPPMQ